MFHLACIAGSNVFVNTKTNQQIEQDVVFSIISLAIFNPFLVRWISFLSSTQTNPSSTSDLTVVDTVGRETDK